MGLVYKISHVISRYNRNRKWRLFQERVAFDEKTKLLDVGFNDEEYFSDVENYLEKHYPYLQNVTALGMQEPTKFASRYPAVKTVVYGGVDFPFSDKSFDICWSNAVLEHVGDFDRQVHFLKEVARVSKRFFITTPNRYFPVEVHTKIPLLHYLPTKWRDVLYRKLGKEWATDGYMFLLSRKDLMRALSAAGIENVTVVENKIGPWTLDFVVYSENK
jgi:SAM-dependent methyltransferase